MVSTKGFLKESVKYTIPSVVSAIVGILVIPLISHIFPSEEFGKINMFYSVGNMLLYIVLMGLDSAYIRFYFEPTQNVTREKIFSLAVWTSLILDFSFCVIAVLFFPQKVGNYLFGEKNNTLIILLGIYVFSLVLIRLLSTRTRMEKRAGYFNVQQILLILTNRVSYVLVAFISTDYKYSVIAIAFSTLFIALIFLVKQCNIKEFVFPRLSNESFKGLFSFAIPFMPTTVMTWLNNSLAKMILTSAGDFSSVGILTIATSLANVFSLIPAAFCVYWSPFLYSNYKTEQKFIKKMHNYIFILSIVMLLGIFCFQDILYMFVGSSYKSSQAYFMLVMLTPIQTLLCETTGYGIILSNKTKYNLYISSFAVVINLIVGKVLYGVLGVYGIVFGIALSAIFQFVAKTIVGQKYYSSIDNTVTTILGSVIILSIALVNMVLYSDLFARIIATAIIIVITVIIYRRDFITLKAEITKIRRK